MVRVVSIDDAELGFLCQIGDTRDTRYVEEKEFEYETKVFTPKQVTTKGKEVKFQ